MVEQFNSECERIVGINLDSFTKSVTDFEDLVTPKYKAVLKNIYSQLSKTKDEIQFELEIVNFMHKTIFLMSNAIALNKGDDDRGHYISVQSAFMDINKLKHKKELISNIIRHDPLTDVLNRSAYEYDMDLIKSDFSSYHLRPHGGKFITFVVIDINGLKFINDALGLSTGDESIKAVANIVQTSLKKIGVIYRTDGDVFFCHIKTHDKYEIRMCLTRLHALTDKYSRYLIKHMSLSLVSKTFSIDESDIDIKKFIQIAEQRMNEAKRFKTS